MIKLKSRIPEGIPEGLQIQHNSFLLAAERPDIFQKGLRALCVPCTEIIIMARGIRRISSPIQGIFQDTTTRGMYITN